MTYEEYKSKQGNFIMTLINFAWISGVIIGIGIIIYEVVK